MRRRYAIVRHDCVLFRFLPHSRRRGRRCRRWTAPAPLFSPRVFPRYRFASSSVPVRYRSAKAPSHCSVGHTRLPRVSPPQGLVLLIWFRYSDYRLHGSLADRMAPSLFPPGIPTRLGPLIGRGIARVHTCRTGVTSENLSEGDRRATDEHGQVYINQSALISSKVLSNLPVAPVHVRGKFTLRVYPLESYGEIKYGVCT